MIASVYYIESFQDIAQKGKLMQSLAAFQQLRTEFGVQGDEGCQSFQGRGLERNEQHTERERPEDSHRVSFKFSDDQCMLVRKEAAQSQRKKHPKELEGQSLWLMWEGPRIMYLQQPEWKTM